MPEIEAGFSVGAPSRIGYVAGFQIPAGLAIMLATAPFDMPRAPDSLGLPRIWRQARSPFH